MNFFRFPIALAALMPLGLKAAELAVVPPDRPFDSVRQDLGALKQANVAVSAAPGLGLGSATGISEAGNFAAPPPATGPSRHAEPDATRKPVKSSGWLLDALEENSRRADTGKSLADSADHAGSSDAPDADNSAAEKRGRTTSTLPSEVASPLSAYMAVWLGPDDYRRLENLNPDLVGSGPIQGPALNPGRLRQPTDAAPSVPGISGSGATRTETGAVGSLRTPDNPFLAAMQSATGAAATAAPPEIPRPVLQAPAVMTAPASETPRTSAARPDMPGSDDRRYFPQLKRF